MSDDRQSDAERFLGRVLIILGVAALALFFWWILDVLLLAFGAVLIAILLRAFAELIERYARLPDRWALAAAMLLVIGALVGAGWLFGSEIRAQVGLLADALPQAWEALQQRLGDAWGQQLLEHLSGGPGGSLLTQLGGLLTTLLGAATNLVLVVFGGVYFALQPEIYKSGLALLFPRRLRADARETIEVCGSALRLWLLGQLVAMLLVGLLTTLGLWLVGIESALALGLIAGLAEFVPIVGPILAAVPGLMLGLAQGGSTALWVLLVYVLVQQVESNMIMPVVERRMVELPPALLLFAVVAMGIVFGPLGVLFATPLTVVAFVLIKKLYVRETLGTPTPVPGEQRES